MKKPFPSEEFAAQFEAAARTDAPEPLNSIYRVIRIAHLRPSPTNPRKHFDKDKLEQLAASIREKGVVEPLIVRLTPGPGDDAEPSAFEIVAGERRFKAAQLARLYEVPCLIRPYTDQQVLEIQLIENLQRDDLTVLEEAQGYRTLFDNDPKKFTAAEIATRIGKSEKYVWDRLKLLSLIPEARTLLEDGRMSGGHAILIARLKPADQTRAIDPARALNGFSSGLWQQEGGLDFDDAVSKKKPGKYDDLKPVSVRELDKWIAEHVRFDVEHAEQAAPLDFGETAVAVENAKATSDKRKPVIQITHEHYIQPSARDAKERTFGPRSWVRADGQEKSKTCEASVLGVVAVGVGYGEAFPVCVDKSCTVHFKPAAKAKASKSREAENKRIAAQQAADKRRQAEETAKRAQWQQAIPVILAALVGKVRTMPGKTLGAYLVGQQSRHPRELAKTALAAYKPRKSADDCLRALVLVDLAHDLDFWQSADTFPKVAKKFGVNVAKILKAVKVDQAKEDADVVDE